MARRVPPAGPRKKPKRKAEARPGTYEEAFGMFLDGDVDGAMRWFEEKARDDPGSPDGHAGLGFALVCAAEAGEALRYLGKARELGDERPYTLLSMGDAHKLLGEHDEAAACYRDALARRPDFAPAHANMAYVHAKRGEYDEAAKSADEARRHDPLYVEAVAVKAVSLLSMGMREEADAVLAEVERYDPESCQIRMAAAYALLAGGDAQGFLERLEGADCIKPGDPGGHFRRACRLAKRGKHAAAYKEYAAAARLEPLALAHAGMAASLFLMHGGDPGERQRAEALDLVLDAMGKDPVYTYAHIARAHVKDGGPGGETDQLEIRLAESVAMMDVDLPGALSRLRALVAEAPGFAEGREALAEALAMSGDARGALAEYEEALNLGASDPGTYNNMGNVCDQLGMAQEAEACYRLASRGPDGAMALTNLSKLCLDQGRARDALEAADGALKLEPDAPDAHLTRGEALQDLDRLPESIRSLEKAVELSGSPEARTQLGQALSDAGDEDGALRCFDEAARMDPDDPRIHHERGLVLGALGRIREARDAYARAVELGPLPQTCANLSMLLYTLHAEDGPGASEAWRAEALALAGRAIELDPDYAFGHFAKSRLLAEAGRDAEASEHLLHAQMLDPDFVWDETAAHLSYNSAERRRYLEEGRKGMEFGRGGGRRGKKRP